MKKMVSVILSVCLLLTLLPTTVFAADQTADAGAKIVEKSYDESTRILTVDMQIKLPDAVGITSVATMISYDSSKLTLLHASNDETSYIATETREQRKAAVKCLLTDKDDESYTKQESALYGKDGRAALLVLLGSVNGPNDSQKTTEWHSIYSLRFKVSGPAATTLDSTSLRIADPKLENELVKYTYDNAHVNNYYTVAVVDGKTGLEYYFGKMQDNPEGELSGMKHLMAAEGNNTATYPGSTNSPSPAAKTLSSIAVTTAPTKTTYTAGENFDPAGMVVTATYSDGSTAAVTDYTVTDGNSLTAGKTSVTISYTEGSETKTCTQTITVKVAPKTLSSIAVTTAPTKTTYTAGENFDPAGMVVTATYSDGSTAAVTGYTVTDGNSLTAGKTSVTISYTEGSETKTCTQAITVNAAPPAPTEYTITFNVNGGIGTIPSQTTSGQKLSSLPTATHSGSYSFVGWYTAASGGTQITTAYVFSANTTVYAHWTYTGGSVGVGSYTPSYTVSVDKTENGTITVSPKSASKGSIVTITVKPDKGYTLETLRALDMSGYAMELTENNGRFTFKMPASAVIVKATFMDDNTMLNFFVDVKASDYFYDAVLWAAEKGVTSGADALHFSPNAPCTRAQIVTFLWRAAGSPAPKNMSSFADVPADAFYAKAVAWAVENGITGGTGDGKFSPDATCTRAQAVTFLYRASGAPAVSGNAAFSDVATNAYYAAAVKWAEKNGITGGIGGGLFGSNNNCTRAQIVTFLYRSVK